MNPVLDWTDDSKNNFRFLKELEYIQVEKSKLKELELRRRKTEEMLRKCSDEAESSLLEAQLQEDQDLEDNQRFLVDNLEFQQLEVFL